MQKTLQGTQGNLEAVRTQGPSLRHQPLLSQLCTASENTGEAVCMQVPVTSLPRRPPERANVRTYPETSRGYSYIHSTDMITCTGDSCYAEVSFNTIMNYVLEQQASEKTQRSRPVLPVLDNMKIRKFL
jgi:hypothetical protein